MQSLKERLEGLKNQNFRVYKNKEFIDTILNFLKESNEEHSSQDDETYERIRARKNPCDYISLVRRSDGGLVVSTLFNSNLTTVDFNPYLFSTDDIGLKKYEDGDIFVQLKEGYMADSFEDFSRFDFLNIDKWHNHAQYFILQGKTVLKSEIEELSFDFDNIHAVKMKEIPDIHSSDFVLDWSGKKEFYVKRVAGKIFVVEDDCTIKVDGKKLSLLPHFIDKYMSVEDLEEMEGYECWEGICGEITTNEKPKRLKSNRKIIGIGIMTIALAIQKFKVR